MAGNYKKTPRKNKISADISEESDEMLKELVKHFERSKGWLIDRMIKNFYNESSLGE